MSRNLILVAIALFTWGVGESAYFFFQPLYLEQLGASPILIGSILGGVGIAMTVSHIPAGYLADRIGRRIMMWVAWFLGVFSGIIMATAKSLPVFTSGILVYGITAFVITPLNSYITTARGKWSVGRALTITSASYNTGAIFGPLLGGFIGDRYGFSYIYKFATGVFILSTIVILFIRSQPVDKPLQGSSKTQILKQRYTNYLPILFLAILGMYLSQPLASIFLQKNHALSLSQIGSLGSISSTGTVILTLGIGALNTKSGFILGQVAAGFFPLFLWQGLGYPWFAVGYFMLGGFRAARAMAIAQVRSLVDKSKMGLAYGIAETVSSLAVILAPPISGFLYQKNPDWIFIVALSIMFTAIILSILFTQDTSDIIIT